MAAMMSYYGGAMMGGAGAAGRNQPEETTLTRTNFMIQFLWQPPAPDVATKPAVEIAKALAEAEKGQGALRPVDVSSIVAKSQELQKKKIQEQLKALAAAPAPGSAPTPAPAATPN